MKCHFPNSLFATRAEGLCGPGVCPERDGRWREREGSLLPLKQLYGLDADCDERLQEKTAEIFFVRMRFSAFVKTVDDVTFDNGMLASRTASRPSEVFEVVRLPVKILKAVVSVPAEIIKLRIDLSDQQKGLAASQQTQIEAQARLTEIQACVQAAGNDQEKQMACFKTE